MANTPSAYDAHGRFIAPAWAKRELWRIGAMMVGFEIAFWLAPVLVLALLPNEDAKAAFIEGTTPLTTVAQFAAFGITSLLFVFVMRRVHGRGFWSLIGHPGHAVADMRLVVIGVGGVLLLLEFLPPWFLLLDLAYVRNVFGWLFWMPFALIALLIQVCTEEIYFRGYLQQQLAVVSTTPLVWMGLPSVVFGLSHYGNGQGFADGALLVVWASLLGLACADLTARTGTLGAAIGLHLVNNLFALVLYGSENAPSSGLALFMLPELDRSTFDYSAGTLMTAGAIAELLAMCLSVLIMWLAARIALRR